MERNIQARRFGNAELALCVLFIFGLLAALMGYVRSRAGEERRLEQVKLALEDLYVVHGPDPYKADSYIRAAVVLQQFGKDEACRSLRDVARDPTLRDVDGTPLIVVCRMLFVAREGS